MRGENTKEKNSFVVDTSFVLAYLLPDEKEQGVEEMFSKFEENKINFVSPYLLLYEIMNGLRSAVVQKRISPKQAELLLDSFLNIGILFEKVDEKQVLGLALNKSITAYDASYVWLAKSKKLKLLTLDETLISILK
jgi:predicted nucleic acid-binding protein